jgi:hypothetical protein
LLRRLDQVLVLPLGFLAGAALTLVLGGRRGLAVGVAFILDAVTLDLGPADNVHPAPHFGGP